MPFILTAAAALLAFASCSMGKDGDYYTEYYVYATLDVDGDSYSFTDDDGETYYPGAVSGNARTYKTTDTDGNSKDGKRVFIRFNMLTEKKEGFDYNIAVFYIEDILSKAVEVAETAADVEAAGDDRMTIHKAVFQGEWFTIAFQLRHSYNALHKITLMDNKTATPPKDMLDNYPDYQYLEFRQLAENMEGTGSLADGIASFWLGDEYHPAKTGKKGFYIRVMNLDGHEEYFRFEYSKTGSTLMLQQNNTPTPNLDRIW